MLPIRDELRHLIDCLSDAECRVALAKLRFFQTPHCPACEETDIDQLEWQDDDETVCCATCGFTWQPNGKDLVHGG